MKRMFSALAAALSLGLTFAAEPASAALLLGHTLTVDYRYPDLNTVDDGPYAYTVGTTPEVILHDLVHVVITDRNITVTIDLDGQFFSPLAFNGIRVFDAEGTAPEITGVAINPATNNGFSLARVYNTGNSVFLNFAAFSTDNAIFSVDLAGGTPAVPEPATWALMIGGFGLVGAAVRRRRAIACTNSARI